MGENSAEEKDSGSPFRFFLLPLSFSLTEMGSLLPLLLAFSSFSRSSAFFSSLGEGMPEVA